MKPVTAIILAAGEGKRMRSRHPKVLHRLCGRPLIGYPLRLARTLADRVVVVVPPDAEEVRAYVAATSVGGPDAVTVVQPERLGTGHAVLQTRESCAGAATILVLPSDMPLLSVETVERLLGHHARTGAAVTILTARVERPQGYGRVLRQGGKVRGVVEERDATDDQKKIDEVNTSVYAFDARRLWSALAEVRADNDQGEYYLTDVIEIAARTGGRIEAVVVTDAREGLGVNDRVQLAAVTAIQRRATLERLMLDGVTVLDPASTYVEDTVTVGPDTVLYPNFVLEGMTAIGAETTVGLGSHVKDCVVGDRVELKPYCVLVESTVEEDAVLGPFCHLRPRAHVGPKAKIGNFVELKKSTIGRGAKVPHLSYVGDATVGDAVNVGAGTITCNYDGVHKHETTIGAGAFIGTNTSLVAPVTIGEGAYIGAGSTITKDVPPGALAVARGHQVVKEGWAARKAKTRGAGHKE